MPRKRRIALWVFSLLLLTFVLAGLLVPIRSHPGAGGTHVAARNDVIAIVMAVKAYYAEYGHYPLAESGMQEDTTYAADNAQLFNVLRNIPRPPSPNNAQNHVHNPRGLLIIDLPEAQKRLSGVTKDGTFVDPWGAPYHVRIDTNYDEVIENPAGPKIGPATLHTRVIAWSWGKDGRPGRSSNIATADVFSWE